ncbi:2-dehydropantoate 2-reductase [Variovorax sp. dw_954]|uniref:ketopantoate reductase family protein n=1 Tax=Variovorax sp. dw_954 TaxID=2720078 RepID=UPI001BD22BAD|nr:2-dehydropantoate 2-reductase [Variovorax sp. dw_954]
MKICIFGAGAIGGYLATHLAQVDGVTVSVIARGEHLAAIRANGLAVESPRGTLRARVQATDNPADLGVQDVVILALKSHQVTAALDGVKALLGPHTAVVPPTTGIPYWYFHDLPGPFANRRIERLDPQGRQWEALAPERVIGCVYWVASEVVAPGVIHHDGALSRFPIGEPDGTRSERVLKLAGALRDAGLEAPVVPDIRAWIWAKMISSLCWNPVATLTLGTLSEMNARPEVVAIVRAMMVEADALAQRLGVEKTPITIDQRIAAARNAGDHKMSMLQDLERGRPLELDVLVDSIEAMREIAQTPTPTIDTVYALLRLRATKHLQAA